MTTSKLSDMSERERAEKVRAAIYKISEAAHAAESIETLFGFIHGIVGELMPAENFYIALHDPVTEEVSFPYFVDACEPPPPPRKMGRGLTEYVLRTGQPLHESAESLDMLTRKGEFDLIGVRPADWLGVPLKTRDTTIGVLVIQSYTEGVRFNEGERNILIFVSEQVAMAIERKQAEACIRESEERYRLLADNSRDLIALVDMDGNTVYTSPSHEQVLGYSSDELANVNCFDLIHPDDLPGIREQAKALTALGAAINIEPRMRKKDGGWVVVEAIVSVVSCDDDTGVRALISGRDVSGRKHAEEERAQLLRLERAARNEAEHMNRLRAELLAREQAARTEAESARREWQTTFDTMTDGVLLVDPDDNLIRANRAMYSMLGLTPDQCIGKPLYRLLHEESRSFLDPDTCPVCMLRRKGEHGVIELPAGVISRFPMVATIDPIVDSEGKTVAVIQVVRDQTELVQAREEAERERISLNAAIEQMGEAILVFDENARLVRANRHAQYMFGFTPEDIGTERILSLIEGRFSDEEGRVLTIDELPVQTSLRERRTLDTRVWYTRPDGRRILLSHNASPFFNDHNELVGAISLARDITEQHREHERVQQADKLRALGQLASGVAHNFNNALAAVIGYTQLALPKIKDPDIEKYLRVVEKSARDAARMVERIQNFSRGRSRTDDFIEVRLADVVRDAIDITRPRWRNDAEALGIKYDVRLVWQADEDLMVRGEPSELREVFVNIIFNALDSMSVGGAISISASTDESNVLLRFTDTGSGMTEEIRRRVFEPFFTTKGVSGLGMGLSESYRIIERHGGRIDVESRLRLGTTFTIALPRVEAAASEPPSPPVEPTAAPARVLIIDDEEFVRSVLATMLEDKGNLVSKAASAEEALDLLEHNEFDMVFTDLAMPRTDGIATATEIKSRWPRTKIVLMSGYGAEKAADLAGDSNCIDAAISKPFNMAEVFAVLKRVLDKN